ncbi:hypothetical protein COLO4_07774 [Corchorus olitorius]|uniref:Uncharacterized protein n=1 Tax=Corchorus olitorius TaxID=93759 RepID=A0A1R3KIR3_9ROSI|nr:hypothetical protein COLO4_07774 [Corchorus olitorius]
MANEAQYSSGPDTGRRPTSFPFQDSVLLPTTAFRHRLTAEMAKQ